MTDKKNKESHEEMDVIECAKMVSKLIDVMEGFDVINSLAIARLFVMVLTSEVPEVLREELLSLYTADRLIPQDQEDFKKFKDLIGIQYKPKDFNNLDDSKVH